MRAFIAVEVRISQRLEQVLAAIARLGSAVRAVTPGRLHITLAFLGEVEEASVARIAGAMDAAATDEAAFDYETIGVGAFPNERRPAVVWAGVRDQGRIGAIVQRLSPLLTDAGCTLEDRPFHAHVTLARIKARPPATLLELMRRHRHAAFGATHVSELKLMKSELKPGGSHYCLLHATHLRGTADHTRIA